MSHRIPAKLSYPQLEISLEKIKHNTITLVSRCQQSGICVAGVTKVFCANEMIVGAMVDGGIEYIADSRIENLKRLRDINLPKILLRLPMISQAAEVVEFADISLNSEIETIKSLSVQACLQKKMHQVILMLDLGDLREGIIDQAEMLRTVEIALGLEGIKLAGIGTNLTCFGGVIPTKDNLETLVSLGHTIEQHFNINLDLISGGGSSSLHLQSIPTGINQLRLGEAIILGKEAAFGKQIEGTHDDCFKLVVEIIEVKEKPSVPFGEIGVDSFGKKPSFVDKGIRRRAICAIGKQDVDPEYLIPDDENIAILGAGSDHLILDVTECHTVFHVGDLITFKLAYAGILSTMTSEYVRKNIQ